MTDTEIEREGVTGRTSLLTDSHTETERDRETETKIGTEKKI